MLVYMDSNKRAASNIWTTLLSDASPTTTSVFASDKSVLILGNDLSGKSVLVSKLQGSGDPHRGSGLDFQVIHVQDEEIDENGICRMWIVDGHLAYRSLLQFALPRSMLQHSVALITVDMSEPWNIPETLEKWTAVLAEHIASLKIPSVELNEFKQKIVDEFVGYADPTESKSESKLVLSKEDSGKTEQLSSEVLSVNFGIPIVVVGTKCDQVENLESELDYREEHFDFIQHYLRSYCLRHGAGLVFTSIKESKNIETLRRYILHKLYGFPFNVTASVVDRDAVFVPIGWDSDKKINIIKESLSKLSTSDQFSTVITRPQTTRVFNHEAKEMLAEEEQAFLSKAQAVLSKGPVLSKSGASDPALHGKPRPSQEGRMSFSPAGGAMRKPDPSKAGANNEKMLANFFNSLLNKKPGGSPSGPVKGARKSTDLKVNDSQNP